MRRRGRIVAISITVAGFYVIALAAPKTYIWVQEERCIRTLGDPSLYTGHDSRTLEDAARWLGKMRTYRSVPVLIAALKNAYMRISQNLPSRSSAAFGDLPDAISGALLEMGKPGVQAILKLLREDGEPIVRLIAASFYSEMGANPPSDIDQQTIFQASAERLKKIQKDENEPRR